MKRIGIEINGVLRDTIGKFKQIYEKNLLDSNLEEQTMISIAKHEALFTEFRIINQQIIRMNSKKIIFI